MILIQYLTGNFTHKNKKTDQKPVFIKYIFLILLYAYYFFDFRSVLLDGIFYP